MTEFDPDSDVHDFIEERYRRALDAATVGMEALRELVPEFDAELAELDADLLRSAMREFEDATRNMRRVGPSLLGEEEYAETHADLVTRRLEDG